MGACTRQCVVQRDDTLAARVPLLRQALAWVGHVQTRNRGTAGGSLAHADPAAELPLAAQVLEARLVLRSKSGHAHAAGGRILSGRDDHRACEPTNASTEIQWPVWRERRAGSAFTEVSRRHGDFAMVAAARAARGRRGRDVARARLSASAARRRRRSRFPRSRSGSSARGSTATLARRRAEAAAALEPGGDIHASADYRRHLAGVLAARVLRRPTTAARTAP